MFLWLLVFALNLYSVITFVGTWQATVSLFFCAVSAYYVIEEIIKKTRRG